MSVYHTHNTSVKGESANRKERGGHPCNGAPLSPGAFVRLDAAALEEGGEGENDHADRYRETQD